MCAVPSRLGWRPLLSAATAAAAGTLYLFSRCGDRQQKTTVVAEVQTTADGVTHITSGSTCTLSVPEPHLSPAPTGYSTPEAAEYTFPPEAGQLNSLLQAFAIILSYSQHCSYVSEGVRVILGELAHLNSRDQTEF
ncbi:hypothetical protein AOLI_G00279990 [Acnodon oligacanthus]